MKKRDLAAEFNAGEYDHKDFFHPAGSGSHAKCAVVHTKLICPCECLECKRRWWAKGRPLLTDDGQIIYAPRES